MRRLNGGWHASDQDLKAVRAVCTGLAMSSMVEQSAQQLCARTGPTLSASGSQLLAAVRDEAPDREGLAVRPRSLSQSCCSLPHKHGAVRPTFRCHGRHCPLLLIPVKPC